MNILVLSPVILSGISRSAGVKCPAGGGWIESIINAMCAIDKTLRFVVICRGNIDCEVADGSVRCVATSDRKIRETIANIISGFRPDVIHINGTEFDYGAFPLESYGGVPVVVSLQGIISGCYPHYVGGLSKSEMFGTRFTLRTLLKGDSIFSVQDKWRKIRSNTEARTIRQHKYFIGRTEWDEAWVRYYNPSAVYFHVNETMRDQFYNVRREYKDISRHTIFCGGAAGYPLKGVHWLIRAVASLKSTYPDVRLRIAAAHDKIAPYRSFKARLKDSAYAMYLRRLIAELGVRDCVVGLPVLSADEMASELKSAELFVLPSLCENSPNSLCEAMLVGTPSIATFVGGVPSILHDGVEGRLVPSSDPAALAEAIRLWFMHPEEANKCAEAARMTAFVRHDRERNAKAMLDVFRKVVSNAS